MDAKTWSEGTQYNCVAEAQFLDERGAEKSFLTFYYERNSEDED